MNLNDFNPSMMNIEIMNPNPFSAPEEQFVPFSAMLGRSTNFDRLVEFCGGEITPDALDRLGKLPMSALPNDVVVQYLDYFDRQRRVRAGDTSGFRVIEGGLASQQE